RRSPRAHAPRQPMSDTRPDWKHGLYYQALHLAIDTDDALALLDRLDHTTDTDLAPLVAREVHRQLGGLATTIARQLAADLLPERPHTPTATAVTDIRTLAAILGRLADLLDQPAPDRRDTAA